MAAVHALLAPRVRGVAGAAPVRIVIAQFQTLTLDATVQLWHRVRGVQIVRSLQSKEQVVEMLGQAEIADVIVCSHSFWDQVYEALPVERRSRFARPNIVVTGPDREKECRQALQRGVTAYVPLSRGFNDLVTAVQVAAADYMYYPRALLGDLPRSFDSAWERFQADNREALSARQLEVARLVAEGMPDRTIATALGLSVRTVQGIVSETMAKLGVRSRIHLVGVVWGGRAEHARTYAADRGPLAG